MQMQMQLWLGYCSDDLVVMKCCLWKLNWPGRVLRWIMAQAGDVAVNNGGSIAVDLVTEVMNDVAVRAAVCKDVTDGSDVV